MMNRTEALEFAKASALEAWDQRDAYEDPVGSYRDNVIDTFNDERVCAADQEDGMYIFNVEVNKLFA